uniref:Uncharacterized protein n=1 Tax=Lotus japonicus TaxID=34305 RepID=I3T452_LOTJA|nr:unknown [Lotus japonicus]
MFWLFSNNCPAITIKSTTSSKNSSPDNRGMILSSNKLSFRKQCK